MVQAIISLATLAIDGSFPFSCLRKDFLNIITLKDTSGGAHTD
jgi:hypothetical protein